jgi:hypothetical protein
MAFVKRDRVRETTITTGTGPILTTGVTPPGFQPFRAFMMFGDTFWYAIVMPGSDWETGLGTYTSTNTITRTSVFESSNGGATVNFGVGSKDIFICQPASQAQPALPSGTLMLFQQTAAPIYWTKQTTHNDKALRIVSGTASSGGAATFSTALTGPDSTNFTTITQSTMASHVHGYTAPSAVWLNVGPGASSENVSSVAANTTSIGADGSHAHTYTINVLYVDLIIASKD